MAATGCSRQVNAIKCRSSNPDTKIAGCTALIQAGQETGDSLSVIYNLRGTAYSSKRDYDRAIQDFSEAIRLSPNYAYIYVNRGSAYENKGEDDLTIQDDNEAIRLSPNSALAYNNRGYAYNRKGDYDHAIQDLDEAIRLKPNQTAHYYNRGNAYDNKGDYTHAVEDYTVAIHLNPNYALAYYDRGNAYNQTGDYDLAIPDYSDAIRLNPKFAFAYLMRGSSYLFQSNLTAAVANFEQAISTAPSSSAAVYAAVLLHVAMKRQGHEDAHELAQVLAAADLSKWPGPLLKLSLGKMTADEVIAVAKPGADGQKGHVCDANYFTGEDALLHQQRATALARFKAARDGCPKGATAHAAALAELKRLGAPVVPAK